MGLETQDEEIGSSKAMDDGPVEDTKVNPQSLLSEQSSGELKIKDHKEESTTEDSSGGVQSSTSPLFLVTRAPDVKTSPRNHDSTRVGAIAPPKRTSRPENPHSSPILSSGPVAASHLDAKWQSAEAIRALGFRFLYGTHGERIQRSEGKTLIFAASNLGSACAEGWCLLTSQPPQMNDAEERLREAALNENCPDAMWLLALCGFRRGGTFAREAVKLLRRAARADNSMALLHLGAWEEANSRYAEAASCYRKAAKLGCAEAAYRLGVRLLGRDGTAGSNHPVRAKALGWLWQAVDQGHPDARSALKTREGTTKAEKSTVSTKAVSNEDDDDKLCCDIIGVLTRLFFGLGRLGSKAKGVSI